MADKSYYHQFYNEHVTENRLAAVLYPLIIEHALDQFLLSINRHKPRSRFPVKAKRMFDLGYLSQPDYHELKLIIKIQSTFAHDIDQTTFSNGRCKDLFRKLRVFRSSPKIVVRNNALDNVSWYISVQHMEAVIKWADAKLNKLYSDKTTLKIVGVPTKT